MNKNTLTIFIAVVIIIVALLGASVVAALIGQTLIVPPTATAIQAQSATGDTASPFFADTYQAEGDWPLHSWQKITVYGETFPACVVDKIGSRSTLTVNPDDSRVCGDLQ